MTTWPALSGHFSQLESGIRPFDIGRDLRPVAELISEAFADELDARGTAALREMRFMSHIGGLLKLLNHSTGEFNDVFNGFVWVEGGRVVGNVTVQRADSYGNCWQIANVAVAPDHRGGGIARRLMAQALEHVAQVGGRCVLLQVEANNEVARHLYESLDFETLGGVASYGIERVPSDVPPVKLPPRFGSFAAGDWRHLYDLANSYSAQDQWRRVRRRDFEVTFEQQMGEWWWRALGRRRILRRCVRTRTRFEAALILTAQRWSGVHEMQLWVRNEQQGQVEGPLVQWALVTLGDYPRWPISVRLRTDHRAAISEVERYGFVNHHTLLTMRLILRDD